MIPAALLVVLAPCILQDTRNEMLRQKLLDLSALAQRIDAGDTTLAMAKP